MRDNKFQRKGKYWIPKIDKRNAQELIEEVEREAENGEAN